MTSGTVTPTLTGSGNGHGPQTSETTAGVLAKLAKPTDDELRDRWIQAHPGTVYGMGDFRRYGIGFYSVLPQSAARAEMGMILESAKLEGVRPTSRQVSSV